MTRDLILGICIGFGAFSFFGLLVLIISVGRDDR